MTNGIYVLVQFVILFIDVLMFAMLFRAILSWFSGGQGMSPIAYFLYIVTEPLILPIRVLFARLRWFEGVPLDIPFLVTSLLLGLGNLLLSNMLAV